MKRLFYIFSIALLLSSCMTTKLERQEMRRKAKCEKLGCYSSDSMMIIRETITIKRDTTIYIHVPGMTVHDTIEVEQDPVTGLINSKKSILQVPFATSYAWVQNGKLHHDLIQKDSLITEVVKDALWLIKENETLRQKLTIKGPPERINYVTGWQWFQIWSGRILLILLFGCTIFITFRKFIPLFR